MSVDTEHAPRKSPLPSRLSWITRIYIPMILKGMLISLREFGRKPVTIQ